jgi:hypothetical protein
MKGVEARRVYQITPWDATCVALLVAYFLYFALPALREGFRDDEMMNMAICWRAGAVECLLANVLFWKPFYVSGGALYNLPLYLYRPGGAFYYLPLYHFFGLNPLPYRVLQVSVLTASIPIVYYLSRRLTCSRSIAFLAVLALCYHPGLANLVFVGAFIYDVLCGFFYFAALAYYIHFRNEGVSLQPLQLLGFLVLYICALNCKEMAVTLPVIILIYEFLRSPRWADWKAFFDWIRSSAAPSLIAGVLTAFYVYGKTHGSGSLASVDPYRPSYSWHNFMASNARFVGELLFAGQAITPVTLLALWTVVFIYAFVRRDRSLQLMAFWIVIVPLPMAFIVPIRGGAPLYLLLFGWAMIFATIAFDLITLLFKLSVFIANRVPGLVTGPIVGAASNKGSLRVFRMIATLLIAFALAAFTYRENQRLQFPWFRLGEKTSHIVQTLRSLDLHPAPGSRILLLVKENFIPYKWHSFFVASLIWNDRSLRIWAESASELTPQQEADVDYIILLSEFNADVIRSPELSKSG